MCGEKKEECCEEEKKKEECCEEEKKPCCE